MSGYFTESNYENAVLQLLNEDLGYTYVYGPDVERDYHSPLYEDVLLPSLQRINKNLPMDALTEAIYKLKNFETGTLLQKNMVFMDYLQNGVPVKYYDKGEERSTLVYLVDFKNPASNEFTVANQWTFIENSEKRPDVILFVNGLPLVIVELKSPSREETDASAAYRQLRNYMYEIPSMFIYNAVCVMSDLTTSKAGTITSGEDRFMEWKTTDGSYENTQHASFDTFFVGLFEKTRFLDIVKNFICFNVDGQNTFKIVKSEKFSEIIQSAMNRYLNGMLTNEEVIQELLKLAKDIAAAAAEGEKLGLTADELAFYDALTKPQAIKDFYEHDELIAITKELTDLLRKNQTIDWQKKESARAGMRRLVKRLLKKHKYPPEGMDDAVQTVMSQCEMWTDNVMTA